MLGLFSLLFVLFYLAPVYLAKFIFSKFCKVKTGKLNIVDDLRVYLKIPFVSFLISLLIYYFLDFTFDYKILIKAMLKTSGYEVEVDDFVLIEIVRSTACYYLTFIIVCVIVAWKWGKETLRKLFYEFVNLTPLKASHLEHFPFVLDMATMIMGAKSSGVYLDIRDSSSALFSGILFSYQTDKDGYLKSIVLAEAVRHLEDPGEISPDDEQAHVDNKYDIPGMYMYFLTSSILNINIHFMEFEDRDGNSELIIDIENDADLELLKQSIQSQIDK